MPETEVIWGSVLAVLGLCGVALVAMAPHGARLFPHCLFKAVAGFPCLTCGGTRAALAILAGHPLSALAWNPLVAAGLMGAGIYVPYAWLVVGGLISPLRTGWLSPPVPLPLRWLAGGALAGNWIYLILMGR